LSNPVVEQGTHVVKQGTHVVVDDQLALSATLGVLIRPQIRTYRKLLCSLRITD
jgi:hypothetical protein